MRIDSSRVMGLLLSLVLWLPASSEAQIQPPSGPVTFCGVQAAPVADTYTVTVDSGAPQAITMAAPVAACPAGATHSFTLPAALFPIGSHTLVVHGTNAFGSTTGQSYAVVVGIAPGQFTIIATIPPAGE